MNQMLNYVHIVFPDFAMEFSFSNEVELKFILILTYWQGPLNEGFADQAQLPSF